MEATEYDWMYTKLDGSGIMLPARERLEEFSVVGFDEDQLRGSMKQFSQALVLDVWGQLQEVEHNVHTEKCQQYLSDFFKYVLNEMSSSTEEKYALSKCCNIRAFETVLNAWKSIIDQFMCDDSWYTTLGVGASGMLDMELRISEGLVIHLKDGGSLPLTTLFATTVVETSEYPQPLWYHLNTLFFNAVRDRIEPEYREATLDFPWFEPQNHLWESVLNILVSLTNMCLMGRTADVSQTLVHRAEIRLGWVPIWQLTAVEKRRELDFGQVTEEWNMEERLASILQKYQRTDGLEQLIELADNLKLKDISVKLNQNVKKLMKERQRELEDERAKLRKIFECYICSNVEKNLAALPCGHTLCMTCFNSMPAGKVLCPTCRKKPDANKMEANLTLKNVADVLKIEESKVLEKQAANRFKNKVKRLEVWKNEAAEKLLKKWNDDFTSVDIRPADLEGNLNKLEVEFHDKMEKLKVNITSCVAHRRNQANEDIERLKGNMGQVERLCDYKSARLQQTEEQLNAEADRLIKMIEQPPYVEAEGNGLKAGAPVRIKLSEIKYDFDILKISHIVNETGLLIKTDESKNLADVLFPSYHAWIGKLEWLEVSPKPYAGLTVGDHVKIRLPEGKMEPHHGWGGLSTSKDNFGKIVKFTPILGVLNPPPAPERPLDVSFPEDDDWTALLSELEPYEVPPPTFAVGTKVWMIKSTDQIGWNAVGHVISCDDEMHLARVKFENMEDEWVGPVTEIEEVRDKIQVGDLVKVKESIKEPRTNWGGVSHDDIGKVKKIDHDKDGMLLARIDFPNRLRLWNCHCDQLEIVRGREARGGRDAGSGRTGLDLGGMLSGLGGFAELAQAIGSD